MTEDLPSVLHERAHRAGLAAPDLAVVVGAGRARVRRRRTTALVAAVVASLLLAGGGLALLPHSSTDSAPAERPHGRQVFLTHCHVCVGAISWADGSTIHQGATTIDVGHTITRYVRTEVGYVFTDTVGRVWSSVGGSSTEVGTTAGPLVSDPDGDLAGWVDGSGKKVAFVVLNQATGAVRSTPGRSGTMGVAPGYYEDASMIAIVGDRTYWRDGDVTEQLTLVGHPAAPSPVGLPPDETMLTVRDGMAVLTDDQSGRITVGPIGDPTAMALRGAGGGLALLAPDAGHVAFGGVEGPITPQVFDTRTGTPVPLDLEAWSALPFQWTDADHIALLVATSEASDYRILTCSATTGECSVTVPDLGVGPTSGDANGPRVDLPIGDFNFPYLHG